MIEWQRPSRKAGVGRWVAAGTLVVAVAAAMAVGFRSQTHRPPQMSAAELIGAGQARSGADQARDADDPALADDEAAAGLLWARANHPADAHACPRYSAAFRKGCAAEVRSATSGEAPYAADPASERVAPAR